MFILFGISTEKNKWLTPVQPASWTHSFDSFYSSRGWLWAKTTLRVPRWDILFRSHFPISEETRLGPRYPNIPGVFAKIRRGDMIFLLSLSIPGPSVFGVSWLDYPTLPIGFQTGHPDRRVLVYVCMYAYSHS